MKRWVKELAGLGVGIAVVVGGFFAYNAWVPQPSGSGQGVTGEQIDVYVAPKPDRTIYCDELVGSPVERFDACIDQVPDPGLSDAARTAASDAAGGKKTLVIGPKLGLKDEIRPTPAQRDLLLGTDEVGTAEALIADGIRAVVVARDLTAGLDRDRAVASLLAQHDHLDRFQLKHVTEHLLVYRVRNSPMRVPFNEGASLLAGLRARLEGRRPAPALWSGKGIRLIASARLQGHTLVLRHAAGDQVERVLDQLATKIRTRWSRDAATEGHGMLADRLGDIRLELHVVTERAPVEPRSNWALFDLWELGVDGMMLRRAEGVSGDEKLTYYPGSEAVTHSMKSVEKFLTTAVREFKWKASRPWQDGKTRLDLIRTSHFMEAQRGGGGGAVFLYRGMPEVRMADLTDGHIRDLLVDGGEWWLANMRADNSINYKYWPTQNRYSDSYNEVRHILATRDLADTWRYRKDDRYLSGSRRAMDWLMQYAIRDTDPVHPQLPHPAKDSLLFRYPLTPQGGKVPNQKLGTVAVALLGWVAWAEATGDHSEDDNIRDMANFVLSQLESNGRFNAYHVPMGHPYYQQKNDIVPGEAALALGEVAEYFGEKEWLDFYPKYLDYYEPWFRERAKRKRPTGRWPHSTYLNEDRLDLVQFGPWSVMANKQAYRVTGDERAAAFGLEVADWMIDNYQWSAERSPFPDYVGGYYKLPGELPAMQSFCYAEGTAAAYHLAATFRPEAKDKYDRATREAIRFLDVMQFDDTSSYFAADPEIIDGGIKYAMNEQKIRIDYVGHGLSTLSQYLDARAADPAVSFDLDIETVAYDPGHQALWGTWGLDPAAPPDQMADTADGRQKWAFLADRMSFTYTPEALVEKGMGRAVRVPYTVDEVRSDGAVVMTLTAPGRPPVVRQVRRDGDVLLMSEGDGETQRFVRKVVNAPVAAASDGDDEDGEEDGL